jgi:membrane protease YdiL (CAAX protease family)
MAATRKPTKRTSRSTKAVTTKRPSTRKTTSKQVIKKVTVNKATSIKAVPTTQKASRTSQLLIAAAIMTVLMQVLLLTKPLLGAYASVITIACLGGIAARNEQATIPAVTIAILPIAYLISLAFPQTTTLDQSLVFYDAILIQAVIYRYLVMQDKDIFPTGLRLRSYVYLIPSFVVLGQLLAILGYGLLRHQHLFAGTPDDRVAISLVIFAVAEELLFRGLIQHSTSKVINPKLAVLITATLYTAASIPQGSVTVSIFAAIVGTILSTAYYFKPSILMTTATNLTSKLLLLGLLMTFK